MISQLPLYYKGYISKFFYGCDALPLTQPTASKHYMVNGHKFVKEKFKVVLVAVTATADYRRCSISN